MSRPLPPRVAAALRLFWIPAELAALALAAAARAGLSTREQERLAAALEVGQAVEQHRADVRAGMARQSSDHLSDARLAEIRAAALERGTADEASECDLVDMVDELQRHRATMARLAAWAEELRAAGIDGRHRPGPFIAAELENRIEGMKS